MASALTAPQPDLLTYQEAAQYLGITFSGVQGAVRNRKLHPIKTPGQKRVFLARQEVEAYGASRGRVSIAQAGPIGGRAPSVNLEELRVKSQMFAGIAGNVAHEARLAIQPVANPEQVAAMVGTMLRAAISIFLDEFGHERMARIMAHQQFTPEDVDALTSAWRTTYERLFNAPMSLIENEGLGRMQDVMEDMMRQAGHLSVSPQGAQ